MVLQFRAKGFGVKVWDLACKVSCLDLGFGFYSRFRI